MKVWLEGKDFLKELQADPAVAGKISSAALAESFDLGYHFMHVDDIFRRVFGT
jgi:adenylosuccinate lyase